MSPLTNEGVDPVWCASLKHPPALTARLPTAQAPQTAELVEPAGALAAIEALYSFVGEKHKTEHIVIPMTTTAAALKHV